MRKSMNIAVQYRVVRKNNYMRNKRERESKISRTGKENRPTVDGQNMFRKPQLRFS